MPSPMQSNLLTTLKGWWDMHALDFHATLSANVTFPVPRGRCMSLNSVGQLETGVLTTAMALFTFPRSDDLSVVFNGGGTTFANDAKAYLGPFPAGAILTLVATGGYELATTEFAAGSYTPGQTLKAINANTNATTGGTVTAGIAYTDPIVGVVSRGIVDNGYGYNALAFWPVYLPPFTNLTALEAIFDARYAAHA